MIDAARKVEKTRGRKGIEMSFFGFFFKLQIALLLCYYIALLLSRNYDLFTRENPVFRRSQCRGRSLLLGLSWHVRQTVSRAAAPVVQSNIATDLQHNREKVHHIEFATQQNKKNAVFSSYFVREGNATFQTSLTSRRLLMPKKKSLGEKEIHLLNACKHTFN